jgi:hypothetical protein
LGIVAPEINSFSAAAFVQYLADGIMTPEERFEHIEDVLARIAAAHLELENAQVHYQKAFTHTSTKATLGGKYLTRKSRI